MNIKVIIVALSLFFCGGVERWDVKTLTDPDANKVSFRVTKTTVAKLVAIPTTRVGRNTKRLPYEMKTYKVTGIVTSWHSENDGDTHLVLQDLKDKSKTLIAEIPGDCPDLANSKFLPLYKAALNSFLTKIKTTNKMTVTGVTFTDIPHNQIGKAVNNIELHPVLKVE